MVYSLKQIARSDFSGSSAGNLRAAGKSMDRRRELASVVWMMESLQQLTMVHMKCSKKVVARMEHVTGWHMSMYVVYISYDRFVRVYVWIVCVACQLCVSVFGRDEFVSVLVLKCQADVCEGVAFARCV